MSKCDHLIQDTTEWPNIRLLVIRLFLANLWWKIVRCSNCGLGTVICMLKYPGNTEITDLNGSILIHENILCLQVSMQDLAVMDVFNGQCHLHKPVKNLIFTVAYFTYLFLISNFGIQIAAICIIHDNAETALVHEWFFVSNDVRMSHGLEYVHLINCIFALLPVHFADINNLHYIRLSVCNRLY